MATEPRGLTERPAPAAPPPVRTAPTPVAPAPPPPPAVARRRLRRVDPFTVLRVSLVFYACLFVVVLTSALILWGVASAAGVIENVESVIEDLFALEEFRFAGGVILRSMILGGFILMLLGTGLNVVGAVLYNLIAELTGGIEVELDDPGEGGRPRSRV